ncbi:secretin N-terminal domain-containing protein [Phenylobacterium sp.]|uniref:secretin N-terminal domain-containing protein n=1 Tax=Phenylobacterium sp. TaxID=1871053 RepID=UPI002E31BB40|nr:secretin N-terminal domain-containing protein [Phenylobacterium sp.]HEX3367536.1 secretin N-terminal domain-containing protein [Phenylobacterium sp.]
MTFSPRRVAGRLALLVALLGMTGPGPVMAQAPTAPQPSGQAQITSVAPSIASPTETHLALTFNKVIPQFSIVTNDSDISVIAFTGAKLGPEGAPPAGKHGLIQSIGFTQTDNILTLTLTGVRPIHVVATSLGQRAVSLAITPAHPAVVKSGPATGPLPSHIEAGEPDDVFEVVPLKYADVSEIVGLLTAAQGTKPNDNFNPQEPAFGSAGVNNGGGVATPTFNVGDANGAAAESVGASVDDTVGIDRRLNAIVLHGPAARVAQLKAHIAKLDVPVTSVILETVFVELTQSGARNVGFDFTNSNGQIATLTYQYSNGSLAGANAVGGAGTSFPLGGATANLQAALAAQIKVGEGRIISKPRIAAQSGATAKIITGDALPILTSIALSGVNAVQQQVQYVNVGVTLQIAPRVSEDGYVTSHVFAEVSSVTGVSQGYPTISQREASTMATVKDGESFIIGGLTQDNSLSTRTKIPALGDIPGLGSLFRNESSTKSKTDLYIIVTPHIVRGRDEAAAAAAALAKGQ